MSANFTPTLSRRTVNPVMAARGLRPAAELAASKPCGTRLRYYAGCRCDACRAANTAYEHQRAAARARGEGNHIVSAEAARAHLAWLSRRGIGRKTAADAAKVAASVVSKIVDGERTKIRAQTERRILAVTEAAAADRAHIDARATWKLIDELLACGYSKARLASEISGRPCKALQLARQRVTARNAELVRRAHQRLRYATAAASRRAQRQLDALRAEGFRPERVLQSMAALAARRGWPTPTLQAAHKGRMAGCLRQQEVELLEVVHTALLEEGQAAS